METKWHQTLRIICGLCMLIVWGLGCFEVLTGGCFWRRGFCNLGSLFSAARRFLWIKIEGNRWSFFFRGHGRDGNQCDTHTHGLQHAHTVSTDTCSLFKQTPTCDLLDTHRGSLFWIITFPHFSCGRTQSWIQHWLWSSDGLTDPPRTYSTPAERTMGCVDGGGGQVGVFGVNSASLVTPSSTFLHIPFVVSLFWFFFVCLMLSR